MLSALKYLNKPLEIEVLRFSKAAIGFNYVIVYLWKLTVGYCKLSSYTSG